MSLTQYPNVRSTSTEGPREGVDLCNGMVYHWRPAENGAVPIPGLGLTDGLEGYIL